jgi:hypothetical protein
MKKAFLSCLALVLCFFWSPCWAAAQETKEHPEHPKSEKKVSVAEIDKAIRADVEEKAKASGGKFPVRDDVLNKTWELELVRVHTDRLQALQDGRYFACVDFKAADGTMVDVDFFLKKEGDHLTVTDTSVHKINGKARYGYKEEKNGVWVRVPAEG